jgi:PAS domain S-box-containing protein
MKKIEQFLAKNPNPVLSVGYKGTVLYSNGAGEPLLHEWCVEVGEKLPSSIREIVQKVIRLNTPEKMEIEAGNRVYLVTFHPLPKEECVNIYGFDISNQKGLEKKNRVLQDEIQSLRARLEEPEELQRAIREGDLDALVMPVSEEDLVVFTLNGADQAYRTLMETANEDVLIVDAEFKITYIGKRLINKIGYSQEEVIGRSWLDFVDEESKVYFDLRMKTRQQGSDENYELKLICQDGSPLWVLASSKLLFDENGKFKGALAMLTDITDRKQTEEKLAAAHSQIQSIIDNTPDIIYAFDLEERFVLANKAVANVLNSTPDRMIGKRRHKFMPKMDADWHEANDRQVFEMGKKLEFEEYSHLPDRSITWLTKKFPLRDAQGRIYAVAGISADITERKRAEEALRESEARLQVVIAHSPDIIFEQDHDLRYNWIFNPASPYAVSDVLGKTDAELLPPDQAQQLESIKRRVLDKGIREQAILQLAPGGELRWYEAIYDPRFNEAGQVIGVLSYTRDITERKLAEEALRESEEKFRNLFNLMGEAIQLCELVLDEEGLPVDNIILDVNLAYETNSGLRREQVIGRRIKEVLPIVEQVWLDRYVEVVRTGTEMHFEEYNSSLDKWFEVYASPMGGNLFVAVFSDITERKRAEEELQKQAELIDLTPDGIVVLHLDGTITFWNQGAQALYGWTSPEAIGQQSHTLLKTRFSQPLEQIIEQVRLTGNWSGELIHCTKDGRQVVVQSRWQARFDDQGNMSEILESNVDITERKRVEEMLWESQALYRAIARNFPDGAIYVFDHDLRFHVAEGEALELLGYTREALEDKTIWEATDEETCRILEERYPRVLAGESLHFETELKGHVFSSAYVPIKDDRGTVINGMVVSHDITERKRAEETARQRLVEIENLYRHAPVGLCELDRELRYVRVNELMAEINGFPAAAHIGKRIRDVVPQLADAAEPEMLLVLETGEPRIDIEVVGETLSQPGVKRSWLERWLPITDAQGLITGLNIVVVETTERKQAEEALRESEERFRTMANAIPQLAWMTRADGYIYWYNERWYAYTGTTPEQMEGWGWQSVHDPAVLPKVLEQWRASIASGQEFDMEFPLRGADGLYRQFLTRGFPLKDAKGQVLQWFGTNTDITERKRREEIEEAINSISQVIHSTLDFDEIMQKTVSEANRVIGSDTAAISLRKDGHWIASYVHGFPEDVIGTEMNDEEELYAVLAVKTRKPVVINDAFNDERVNRNHMEKWGIRSVLVVPLIIRDEVIGVIFFNCYKSIFAFDDIHVDFATRLASSISLALENSRIFKKLETELIERKKAGNELREAYEKIQKQSEKLQVFNEELQVQSEELHEANEALQKSEKRFRTLAENSPDVITRFDRQNRHMYANPAASEAYGFSQEEIIGKTHGELERNPELVKFLETYQEIVFTTGKPEAMEFHYKSPQGKEYYFNTKIVPEFANGKVTSVLAISRDITDIKEAEAKLKETLDNLENLVKARTSELEEAYKSLKESEKGLAEAQEMAHIGNWVHNIKTGEVHWSDEVYRIFGFKPQEFDVTYNIFLSKVHPDDRDFVNNAFKQALNGNIFDIEYRIVLAGGVERIVHEEFKVIFDKENIPILLNGTVQDITERKKVEETLELANAYNRSLIEASIDPLVTIGPNGKITDVNNSTEFITGYSRYELIGTDFSDYFTEPKKAREGYQHVFQKGLVRNYPLEIQHKNGNITPVLYNASVYRDKAGKVVGVFAAAHDITELKKVEEYLAKIEIARKQEIHHRT